MDEPSSTGPGSGGSTSHFLDLLIRAAMFVVGAAILFIEIEFRHPSRVWVIALALVLMGLVSLEQVLAYVNGLKH